MLKEKFKGLSFRPSSGECPICGDVNTKAFLEDGDFRLRLCGGCDVVFVDPQPDLPSISSLYADDYFQDIYLQHAEACTAYFQPLIEEIGRVQTPGRMLEVGPGPGYFLRASRDAGWRVAGVELSQFAANRLRADGFDVFNGTLEEYQRPAELFDVVVMWDVLEHMPDPLRALKLLPALLRPNGSFVLKVPNRAGLRPQINAKLTAGPLQFIGRRMGLQNYYADHGFHHLFHFGRTSIRRALELAGFQVKLIRSVDEPEFARHDNLVKRTARVVVESVAAATHGREALLVLASLPGLSAGLPGAAL